MTPSRGTRTSYSVHDGQVSGDPTPAGAGSIIFAYHRQSYRTARVIIAVSSKYLAAGLERRRISQAGRQVSEVRRGMMYGDPPPNMLKYLPIRGCHRLLHTCFVTLR